MPALGSISAALGAVDHAYWVSASSGGGYRALSSPQSLHTRFGRSGVALSMGKLHVGLNLRAVGYGRALTAVGDGAPSVRSNRVAYAHAGLTEWYVNGPRGLEQGFTVPRAPAIEPGGALTLSIALSGDAHVAMADGGRGIVLRHGASALRYTALSATDATGRTLHSWMSLQARQLKLSVDTGGARYPVTVDPLIQLGKKLTASEAVEEEKSLTGFRVALSADGRTALVGAPRDHNFAGAALVFTRSGATWTHQGVLAASEQIGGEESCAKEPESEEEEPGCGFGSSVALSADGNTALIGGQRDNGYAGGAWVFTRSSSGSTVTWSQQGAKLVGDCTSSCGGPKGTGETGAGRFGRSVALSADGNTALIGAPVDHLGAAWVFTRSGSVWSQQGSKIAGGEGGGSGVGLYFGASVALSGDGNTALIGDPGDAGAAGAVWTFSREGTAWAQQGAKLTGGSEESGEGRFGFSVALSADASTALIGARNDNAGAGAAWAFSHSGSTWTHLGVKLTGGEEANGVPKFGYSVALSSTGETALIGARGDSGHRGAAWLFTRAGALWTQQEGKLTGGGEVGAGNFGTSVALSANAENALVGGPDDNGKVGAAWAFTEQATVTRVSPTEGPPSGGTKVTISGSNFGEASAVHFGKESAPSFTVNSANSISAVSPPGKGIVDVAVETPGGPGAASSGDQFSYLPMVAGVSPDEGPAAGGTSVTITGANLTEATAVNFGTGPRSAASFSVNSDNSITAVVPGATGTVNVTVTTPGGTSAIGPADKFTYRSLGGRGVRPTITNTSPVVGPTAGGTIVTITGTSLSGATTVKFGSTAAASFKVVSATEIAAVSPPRPPETVDVTVATPAGTSLVTAADRFTFADPQPTVSGGGLTGTKAPSGGLLGFGPFLVSSCTVSLRGKTLAVQSYKRAAVKLSWAGAGTCRGSLKLTVKRKVSHPKRGQKRFTIRTIGAGTFSIAPGAVRTVTVSFNALGRALLKARHGRLNASIAITKLSPGPVQARTASVRLALQKPHKNAKHKK